MMPQEETKLLTPEELELKLSTLSFADLQSFAQEISSLISQGDVPASLRPVIEAVIKELNKRKEQLTEESTILQYRLESAQRAKFNKERQYLNLLHEKHRLEQLVAIRESQIREKQETGSITYRRNDPCPCGSGKKYKHCCGKL